MGLVYLGVDVSLMGDPALEENWSIPLTETPVDARLALKVIHPVVQHDPEARASLMAEFLKARGLQHPNIIRTYAIHEDGQLLFYTMELLEGEPLSAKCGPLRPKLTLLEVLAIMGPVADALAYAHGPAGKHVIHRDVSTKNIFIGNDGIPKLLDFGIAAKLQETFIAHGERRALQSQDTTGNDPYMSPERFKGGTPADLRDDVYSLAVVIFECLTGDKPFHGGAIYQCSANFYPDPPPGLNKQQWQVLRSGLAFDREQREPDPVALVNGLYQKTRIPMAGEKSVPSCM